MWTRPTYGKLAIYIGLLGCISLTSALVLGMCSEHVFDDQESTPRMTGLDQVRFAFESVHSIPDPNDIQFAGQWYFLNHVSSPLLQYDYKNMRWQGLLADSWRIDGNAYTFKLKGNLKFNDGTAITAKDVAATIQRIVREKKVTHFPLWEYLSGCEESVTLFDCSGISIIDDLTIQFKLNAKFESFFLALSSPETGIWSTSDLQDIKSFIPRRFSGPYAVSAITGEGITLLRNAYSPTSQTYPNSPKKIFSPFMARAEIEVAVQKGQLDLFIGDYIPFNEFDWEKESYLRKHYTTPSSVLFLSKSNRQEKRGKVGSTVLNALWQAERLPQLIAATTYLPAGSLGVLSRSEISSSLPVASSSSLRIAFPSFYFKPAFIEYLQKIFLDNGVVTTLVPVSTERWFQLLSGTDTQDDFDFTLSTYVASERYPAVQLRYMLYGKSVPNIDVFALDDIVNSDERRMKIKEFETATLDRQWVIPLFFIRTHIVYSEHIVLGDHPETDAEVHLWKLLPRP